MSWYMGPLPPGLCARPTVKSFQKRDGEHKERGGRKQLAITTDTYTNDEKAKIRARGREGWMEGRMREGSRGGGHRWKNAGRVRGVPGFPVKASHTQTHSYINADEQAFSVSTRYKPKRWRTTGGPLVSEADASRSRHLDTQIHKSNTHKIQAPEHTR